MPGWEFAQTLVARHAEVLLQRLENDGFDVRFGSVVCSSGGGSFNDFLEYVNDMFPRSDFNLSLLADDLTPTQGMSATWDGGYDGGSNSLKASIGFLIYHELRQESPALQELYRNASSRETVAGNWEYRLRWPEGGATAAAEMDDAYDVLFMNVGSIRSTRDRRVQRWQPTTGPLPGHTQITSIHASATRCGRMARYFRRRPLPSREHPAQGCRLRATQRSDHRGAPVEILLNALFVDPNGDRLDYRVESSFRSGCVRRRNGHQYLRGWMNRSSSKWH